MMFPILIFGDKPLTEVRAYDFLWITDSVNKRSREFDFSVEELLYDHISREFVRTINDWRRILGKSYSDSMNIRINATELIETTIYKRAKNIKEECKINIRMTAKDLKNRKNIELPHPLQYFSSLVLDVDSGSGFMLNKFNFQSNKTYHIETFQYEEDVLI